MKFGLDFGTTNSSIAIAQNGTGVVLPVDIKASDPRVVRSMLYLNRREIRYRENIPPSRIKSQIFEPGDIEYIGEFHPLIGQAAVAEYMTENANREIGIKRTIFTGRIINTETLEQVKGGAGAVREYYEETDYGTGRLLQALKTALKSQYYKGTTAFGHFFSLEELISCFIKEMKQVADKAVEGEIKEVVCGRPVHFLDDPEKDKQAQQRLEDALKLAGFARVSFEFEPVAAAKQFLSSFTSKATTVLIFDFGGGTLDTAIVRSQDDKYEVLATDGIYIGGDLLNADIMRAKLWGYFGAYAIYGDHNLSMPTHVYEALGSWYTIPNLNNPNMMNLFERVRYKNSNPKALDRLLHLIKANLGFDLYESIENAKKELSSQTEAKIIFKNGPIDIDVLIEREEFEDIIRNRVEAIEEVVHRTLKTAKLEPGQIDVVVRTGGSSLIPIFENMLIKIFGRDKLTQFETFTSIASGLALN